MTVNYTSLLSLGQPVTGTESGTWGDDVNNAVTSYLDIAIAGTLTLTGDGSVTLANTQGTNTATNIGATTAQYYVLKIVGPLTATKVITAPSTSKSYIVVNTDATYGVTVKASGQSGVTVPANSRALVAFNGTDYVFVSGTSPQTLTGLGTGVATALGVNVGSSGAFVTNGGALGTPSSGTVTNLTGTASININGTVGATTPTTGSFTTLAANGNVTISGSSRRIQADFSSSSGTFPNIDVSARTLFQTSTVNNASSLGVLPNGTGTYSDVFLINSSTATNASFVVLSCDGPNSRAALSSNKTGTGTLLPLVFDVDGERMRVTTDGEVYIAGTADQGAYNLQVNGTGVWGAGAYVNGSDARIKENIKPLQSGLDVVSKLNPVTFQYKTSWMRDNSIQPGFIAQELKQALDGKDYVDGVVQQGPQFMSVAYQTLIPILVKAIQELKAEVAALKGE